MNTNVQNLPIISLQWHAESGGCWGAKLIKKCLRVIVNFSAHGKRPGPSQMFDKQNKKMLPPPLYMLLYHLLLLKQLLMYVEFLMLS